MLVLLGASILACGGNNPPPVETQPKVGLVAQGESFSNLTAITENLGACDEADTNKKGEVVFQCFRENHWDLYLKSSPTSTAVQKLTTHGAMDINPAISPDGTKIAFSSNRSGNYDIFIMSLAGGTAKQQVTDTSAVDYAPHWAPDGKLIAYTRKSEIDDEPFIWFKNLETNANIQVGPGVRPKFSPDGTKVLFQRASQQGQKWFSLWTMDLNGGSRTQLVASDEWGAIDANWSPDGKKIVFVSSKGASGRFVSEIGSQRAPTSAGNNLWVINADGSNMTQLTTHPKDDIEPHWSSGNYIYFTSWRDGEKRIWRFTPILPDNYVPDVSEPSTGSDPDEPVESPTSEPEGDGGEPESKPPAAL
jgi:TolB protein